ncbi:MAG: hypothetical protein H7252_01045 [Cytophaga sp.]|nr:hypothetical protein [Undibacterium sp.]
MRALFLLISTHEDIPATCRHGWQKITDNARDRLSAVALQFPSFAKVA